MHQVVKANEKQYATHATDLAGRSPRFRTRGTESSEAEAQCCSFKMGTTAKREDGMLDNKEITPTGSEWKGSMNPSPDVNTLEVTTQLDVEMQKFKFTRQFTRPLGPGPFLFSPHPSTPRLRLHHRQSPQRHHGFSPRRQRHPHQIFPGSQCIQVQHLADLDPGCVGHSR